MPPPPPGIRVISYADDIYILSSGPIVSHPLMILNSYLEELYIWFGSRNLALSPAKSSVTLFTTSTNKVWDNLANAIQGNTYSLSTHKDKLLELEERVNKLEKLK